jgi:hypothetical protein
MKTKLASFQYAFYHLRNEMGWRDEAYCVATFTIVQLDHHFGEALYGDFVFPLLFPSLTNFVVLAIAAFEIAIPEKYITDSMSADKRRLLAKMRAICRDNRQPSRITPGNLASNSVHIAIERADIARFQHNDKLFAPASEFAGFKKCAVWRVIHKREQHSHLTSGMFLDLTRFPIFITRYPLLITRYYYAILASKN